MKNKLVISILFLGFFAQTHLYGQTSIEISGTIMSPRGPEPGVQVELYNSNGSFITTCLTDINGKFKTIRKLNVGQTVQIRINKKEFQPFEQTYRIDKTGNAGELMLERRKIAISGFVKDSVHNEPPLQGVEVFFYDDSKLIQSKSTNSQGYFVIETDFNYGQKITVRFSKKDFFSSVHNIKVI